MSVLLYSCISIMYGIQDTELMMIKSAEIIKILLFTRTSLYFVLLILLWFRRQRLYTLTGRHIGEGDAAPACQSTPQVSSRSHSDKTQVGPAGRGVPQVSSHWCVRWVASSPQLQLLSVSHSDKIYAGFSMTFQCKQGSN